MTEQNLEMVQIGCLLFFSAYHMILYFQIKRRYYLYLFLLGLAVLIRASLVYDGSGIFYDLFPQADFFLARKIEFLVVYSTLFLAPMFINDLFSYRTYARYIKFFQIEGSLLMAFVLFAPYSLFRQTLDIYHLSMIGSFILVFIMLFRAMRNKRTGANQVFYGVVVCFVFVFIEMLKNSQLANFSTTGPNLVNSGVVLFFFFQSTALSAIFAKSFKENKRLNEELEGRVSARTEQLTKSNVVKERFIRIVSHDLRGPLGNLKTMIGLVNSNVINKKQSSQIMEKIDDNLNDSLDMLDNLLDWTKATTETELKTFNERILINEIIETTIHLHQDFADQKQIKLKFKKPHKPVYADTDTNAIKVILRNLIHNGIKFSKNGGEVSIKLDKEGDSIVTSIIDNGIGVPEEMKETLFEMDPRNSRLGTNKEKSTGVGLALCKDLVTQIGGEIWVEDNDPEGSVFKLLIATSDR